MVSTEQAGVWRFSQLRMYVLEIEPNPSCAELHSPALYVRTVVASA